MKNQNLRKQIRLKQDQILTPELFDKVVRYDIDRSIYRRLLTDRRIDRLINEVKPVSTDRLKQEIHDLFFKSFAEVHSNVVNTRLDIIAKETPLNIGINNSNILRIR